MLKHFGVELTDYCNLNCPNCPNSYSTVEKGYVNDEIFDLAVLYSQPGQVFQLHGHGESLLHPDVLRYTEQASHNPKGLFSSLSTNGVLLDRTMLDGLLEAGLKELYISLHVPKSVDAFVLAVDVINSYKRPVKLVSNGFIGNTVVDNYIEKLGVYQHIKPYMGAPIEYFTWCGAVKGKCVEFPPDVVESRKRRCWFMRENLCSIVLWDGSVVSCCYDFNHVNYLGHVRDFPNLVHTPDKYELCKYCEPKYANNFM
jgi:hypothetical protein